MKFSDFLLLVAQMRESQRGYYANRTQSNLIAAKARESEVDQAIRRATDELSAYPDTRQYEMQLDEAAARSTAHLRRKSEDGPSVDERLERRHT